MTRVAAVDLGTNSTRLLVADVNGEGLTEVSRRLTITRLGEGVDERRRLLPVPVARVRNCLVDYRRELEALGAERTLCIATSSVRDAENGEAFLGEVEWSYGFTTRLLSGEEEAALMLRGVTAGRPGLDDVLVVDIGGGSTELVVATESAVAFATSLAVGCVRLTERFLRSDPPSPAETSAAGAYVRSLLPALEASMAIGVAGTVTTLATLDLGDDGYDPQRTHGHRLSLAAIEELLKLDGSLTYRVLRTVNSAGFGLRREIHSVREALLLLGLDQIRRWTSVWLLAGANRGPSELVTMTVLRGRACELVGQALGRPDAGAEYFLLGMCSLLDVILGQPMSKVVNDLPLGDEIRAALLGQANDARRALDAGAILASGGATVEKPGMNFARRRDGRPQRSKRPSVSRTQESGESETRQRRRRSAAPCRRRSSFASSGSRIHCSSKRSGARRRTLRAAFSAPSRA